MQNTPKKVLGLVVAVLAAVAALLIWRTPKQAERLAASAPAPAPVSATTKAATSTERIAPPIVLRDRYELVYHMTVKERTAPTVISLTSTVDVSEPADGVSVVLMSDVRVTSTGPRAAALSEKAHRAPWKIHYREDGGIAEVSFASETPQNVRGALLQIASLCQLKNPISENAPSWSATEHDANGEFTAHYARKGPHLFHKTFGAAEQMEEQNIYTATGDVRIETGRSKSEDDAIDAVIAKVAQRVRFAEQSIDISVELELRRPAGARVAMSAEQAARLQQELAMATPFDASKIAAPSQAQQDKQRVAGRSFERIVEDITKADTIGNWQLRKSYGFDLAALMRLDPSTVDRTLAQINLGAAEPVRRTLIESLANARTDKGQVALARLMQDKAVDADAASQARTVSSFVEKPVDELLDQLEKDSEADDVTVRRPALFALASLLGTRHDDGIKDKRLETFVARGAKVVADFGIEPIEAKVLLASVDGALLPDLKNKKTSGKLTDWLQLLGATHAREALPLLAAASRHADHIVRAKAVLAIRHIEGAEPALLLSDRALKDPTYYVRSHAVTALADLGEAAGIETVKTVLASDTEDSVRAEAAFTIGRWSEMNAGLKAILQKQLENERSDLVVNAILDATVPGRGYLNGKSHQLVMGKKK
jgi:HEAT repeat protein